MHTLLGLALLIHAAQPPRQPPRRPAEQPPPADKLRQALPLGNTSPESGDTVGYWQQRTQYTLRATLDEERGAVRATGELTYTNNSPDTLRQLYLHQYLNAFRPGSKWSESDARENRVRFQNLVEPNYAYERFTAVPMEDSMPVRVVYPNAPDSTVVRFDLPRAIAPGATVKFQLAWEARPSTVFRRQGRRGRTYDFAQWYPKVAVYDRGGWQPNPLIPAGELYGEFGDYDVTLITREDQVLAATGVPVSGDPGWARVSRTGAPRLATNAYGAAPTGNATVPTGYRGVRFQAKDVHHFAWSASTEYIYEGGVYVRPPTAKRQFATWDTVSVHVLFKPGDDTTWGRGIAVRRTIDALGWLEGLYGPYAYPQVTNVHRLDGGGTEFPMLVMDGSPSYGLILHEVGHIFTYGILANNEWRSGWMDEGFAEYQTYWAQGLTPQERIALRPTVAPDLIRLGYRANALTIRGRDSADLPQHRLELLGRAEPPGTEAADFRDFGVYNSMIYDRARAMFGHLRDLMGDSVYKVFMQDYYGRWALKHVDERALRTSAARAYQKDLGWFFDQWVHQTGLLDYGLHGVRTTQDASGRFVTNVDIERTGAYRHPMPVGIHTSKGWSVARAFPELDRQILQITTAEAPDSVVIDPFHVTWDWDRRNDRPGFPLTLLRRPRPAVDWAFLDQSDRDRTALLLSPLVFNTGKQGAAIGVRARTNYLTLVDRYDAALAVTQKNPLPVPGGSVGVGNRLQLWARVQNPLLPFMTRPLMGYAAGVAHLDGITELNASRSWDLSPFATSLGPRVGARVGVQGAYPSQSPLLPEQWTNTRTTELSAAVDFLSTPRPDGAVTTARLELGGGFADVRHGPTDRGYARALASVTRTVPIRSRTSVNLRLAGGWTPRAPYQRSVFASSKDPLSTFTMNSFRPSGALLKQKGVNYRPLGGAGLRGYSTLLAFDQAVAANAEVAQRVYSFRTQPFVVYVNVFADIAAVRVSPESAIGTDERLLSDGGFGATIKGRLWDRSVTGRVDVPFIVSVPSLGQGHASNRGTAAVRWAFSLNDLF
jgi:hypothetical protein